ncbi:hypothetical protein AB1J02_26460 [Bacillus paranthracis]|nr:hypothetical protein B4153_6048 [Bacillus cereus]UTQ80101.1 hypothetical protein vBBceSLY4_000024 [Bacillus phage vB_BceS_LY4]
MDLEMYPNSVLKDALLFIGNDRNLVLARLRTIIKKEIVRRQGLGIWEE